MKKIILHTKKERTYKTDFFSFYNSQISDWLMLNREMLKQQSIPVGDIDVITNAIDRQKVKKRKK